MSTATRRGTCAALFALAALAGPVPAQPKDDDAIRGVLQRRAVEAQRVEKEVKEGREYAYRVARTDLAAALEQLNTLTDLVSKDTSLREDRRDLILRYLERDVRNVQDLAARGRVAREDDAYRRATQRDVRRTEDPRAADERRGAAATAASRIGQMGNRVADARGVNDRVGDRFLGVHQGIMKSAQAPVGDVEFPPDWLEKSKRRSPRNQMTAKERDILDALNKPIPVDFNMDTLQGVLNYISKAMGQNIAVDRQALEEVNATYDTPITLQYPKPVSTRTALKRILADLNLTYVVRNETIEVTSITRAREMLTTRTYYVGDLVNFYNPFLTPGLNRLMMIDAVNTLINTIINQTDPQSWQVNGGPGGISFDPISMSLIVRQTAEVHFLMGGGH